jgi:hypothetical protein
VGDAEAVVRAVVGSSAPLARPSHRARMTVYGVGWIIQLVPFQRSESVTVWPVLS